MSQAHPTTHPKEDTRSTHEMVVQLYDQYQYDYIIAVREASKIQRELSRAEHEANRIARHLRRIEDFCKQNNVSLNEGN